MSSRMKFDPMGKRRKSTNQGKKAHALGDHKQLDQSLDEDPEAILGLEQPVAELPGVPHEALNDLPGPSFISLASGTANLVCRMNKEDPDKTNDEDLGKTDDEDLGRTDDEDIDDGEEAEDEEAEDECGDDEARLPSNLPNREELMKRLMNDSISFSELTAMMGGEETEADETASVSTATRTSVSERDGKSAAVTKPVSSAEHFEQELDMQRQQRRRRGRARGVRGRGTRLHPTLAALMGQANLCVGHSDTNEAIKMCLEIIRQFPNSHLPYETLAMIYEDQRLQNKSLQFQLMAAFLSPLPDKWVELAEYYKDQDELEQAVYCYSRAIKQSPATLSYHWSRVELLERLGNQARALRSYTYMLKFLKPDQAKGGLRLAREIAKIHFSQQNYSGARHALETAFVLYSKHVTHEHVNLLLDVLVTQKDYKGGLAVLCTYAGVKFSKLGSDGEAQEVPPSDDKPEGCVCSVGDDLPMDLRSKLAVCLVMTGAFEVAQPVVEALMKESTEVYGDLYMDVAEAFLSMKHGRSALSLLQPLLRCPHHGSAANTWRLYAEALLMADKVSNSEDAVNAYYKVVEFAPENAMARLTLAAILHEQRQTQAALLLLDQDPSERPLDCQVLYSRCGLLLECGLVDEFVENAKLLLAKHFVRVRSRDEAEVLINNKKASNKLDALRELRESKGEPAEDREPRYTDTQVPLKDQWQLFCNACRILYRSKRFSDLEALVYGALGSRLLAKKYGREVEFLCLQASMANSNSHFAFNLMRDIVVRSPQLPRAWNLLNQVISRANDFRHNRFLLRLSQKHPEILACSMLNGHNCLVAGTYKYSLAEYMKVFKRRQHDPLASLMLGLTYIHMACQKFSADKNTLVTQAWVFLNSYRELRGDCQESLYNIGRAMHQLNVLHQAIYYYELALSCPRPVQEEGQPCMDLTHEIAFSLALLYKKNSPSLARYYTQKYITV
ncbi:general transcription factor 3C polypeptide 3 [Hyalella azteca]|uniref:General transcription factor 3C polypeptide 3 n=1 Tax=Hyalella azteca TaxID=294128 RepID=A0A8B7NRE3_HYAAZ|nr:general transcription factor 3C polypeptide 3 [Hyalella azteca]